MFTRQVRFVIVFVIGAAFGIGGFQLIGPAEAGAELQSKHKRPGTQVMQVIGHVADSTFARPHIPSRPDFDPENPMWGREDPDWAVRQILDITPTDSGQRAFWIIYETR